MRRAAGLDKTAEKWNKLHPKEANARFLVAYAVRCGRIKKTKCVKCGNKNSQAHHEDYDKPLEVIWLCPVCHKALHMKKDKKWAVYK
jgi:ribosomal protein S27AE